MRTLFLLTFFLSSVVSANTIATAKVSASGCTDKELIQLIVIKKDVANQFLYQVGVPHGGTADFNLIPGEYRIEAISDKACFGVKNISISEKQENFSFKLELKK